MSPRCGAKLSQADRRLRFSSAIQTGEHCLQPGDPITVLVFPSRNPGSTEALIKKTTKADRTVVVDSSRAGKALRNPLATRVRDHGLSEWSRKNFTIRSEVLGGYSWPPAWIQVITGFAVSAP